MRSDESNGPFGMNDVEFRADLARNRGSSRLGIACMDSVNLL